MHKISFREAQATYDNASPDEGPTCYACEFEIGEHVGCSEAVMTESEEEETFGDGQNLCPACAAPLDENGLCVFNPHNI